jgi:hypothetical protein
VFSALLSNSDIPRCSRHLALPSNVIFGSDSGHCSTRSTSHKSAVPQRAAPRTRPLSSHVPERDLPV